MKTVLKVSLMTLMLALLSPLASQSLQAQGRHPVSPRFPTCGTRAPICERPDGGVLHAEERDAIHEIDEAIKEIKHAAIDDGKNIEDHAPVDAHLPWAGRLHEARKLFVRAHDDVAREEDNPATHGLQVRVLEHIDRATHRVDAAIAIANHR